MKNHVIRHIEATAAPKAGTGSQLMFTREQLSLFTSGTFTESKTAYSLTVVGNAKKEAEEAKVSWKFDLPRIDITEAEDTYRVILKFIESEKYLHQHGHREIEADFLIPGLSIGFARTDEGFWAFLRVRRNGWEAETRFKDYRQLQEVYYAYKQIIN